MNAILLYYPRLLLSFCKAIRKEWKESSCVERIILALLGPAEVVFFSTAIYIGISWLGSLL